MTIQGAELARACAKAADEIQAENIRVWDLRGISSLTDFMVVCAGSSMPHLRAILRDVSGIVIGTVQIAHQALQVSPKVDTG